VSDRADLPVGAPGFGLNPSFADLVRRERPEALPQTMRSDVAASVVAQVPHGTTVLGMKYADGVIVAGDRRATAGYSIADDKMRKVFAADDYSAIAIAGAATWLGCEQAPVDPIRGVEGFGEADAGGGGACPGSTGSSLNPPASLLPPAAAAEEASGSSASALRASNTAMQRPQRTCP